jgi:hypothetical protein
MTDYLKPSFTLPAGPPGNHPWPFPTADRAKLDKAACGECGATTYDGGRPHIDKRDADEKRSTKRVCFGKVIAR